MEQLININEVSRVELTVEDLPKLHWYALFVELGKHLIINAEWNRIKTLNEPGFEDIVAFWSPYWRELCDGKLKTHYYYQSYLIMKENILIDRRDRNIIYWKKRKSCASYLRTHLSFGKERFRNYGKHFDRG